jgi:hypothetical protein
VYIKRKIYIIALLVIFLLTACSGTESESQLESGESDVKKESKFEINTPTAIPEDAWLYVAMGDSFTGLASWPEKYAAHLEQELGVDILFKDRSRGSQKIIEMLERIRTDEGLRKDIMQAELITVSYGSDSFRSPVQSYRDGTCGGTDGQDCLREAFSQAELDWGAFLDELIALRSPEEAPIVTFMIGVGLVQTTCEWGSDCWDVGTSYFIDWCDFLEQSATDRGIYVVDVNRYFNGEDYRQPTNKDLLLSDGFHLNSDGSAIIVDLLKGLNLDEKPPLSP